jgi:hypothetical protein
LRGPHATFDRRAHRAPAEARTGNGFSNENEQRMSDPHKQQTSAVSLLIAAVVALWLVLVPDRASLKRRRARLIPNLR